MARFHLWLTTLIAVYHLSVVAQLPTWFGVFIPDQVHEAVSILSALVLLFVFQPKDRRFADRALLVSAVAGGGFVVLFHDRVLEYSLFGFMDRAGTVVALLLAVPLLLAARRVAGWALPAIILFFVLMTMFQRFLPGILYGAGFPIDRVLFSMYVGDAGIFGPPLRIAANIVIVYLIFGALMDRAGAGKWFMDLSLALTGWSRGGPAKAAVVASAMFGSISGSPSGNAATTGVFTIPMMKSIGYSATFAAAVEAVASTGGMILPPVMAAIAFLMATWIEVPYTEVVYAAALPAALYFLIVFISVWGLASFYNAADMYRGLRDLWHCWEQDLGDGQGSDAGVAAFIVPFAFVLNSGLLLVGDMGAIARAIVTSVLGATLVAVGVRGYAFGVLPAASRCVVLVASFLLIAPGSYAPVAGLALAGAALLHQRISIHAKKT